MIGPSICWRESRTKSGRVMYRPVWERYHRADGTVGYRAKRRWPQWYALARVVDGELLGSLHQEYKRCGKSTCRCASGLPADLHGPYWVRRWRDAAGRTRKQYVRKDDVNSVRDAIERRVQRLKVEREKRQRHMGRGVYSWKGQEEDDEITRELDAMDPASMSTHDLIDLLTRFVDTGWYK